MPLTLGSRIGPYEIVVPLGAGAMGEVYRARDTRLARMVAIKVLAAADPRRIGRLEREARAISRVSHPHICALHDIGHQDGLAYLVMEYLEGETLAQRLERGALQLGEALSVALQICEALDAAHTAGVVHRDLKPGNVMLTASGVKLLDFGLAKLREPDPNPDRPGSTQSGLMTEDGAVLGTYPYMAPEQITGGHVDAGADIFALGVVIYEMVSGRRPFDAPTRTALAAAILTHEPAGLAAVRSGVPAALDRVVGKCLAKDPKARWQTARDLASELRWIAEDAEGRGHHTSVTPRDRTKRSRRRAWPAVGVVAGLIAGAVAVWGLTARGLIGGRTSIPRFTQATFRAGTVLSARFAPDGETIIYSAAWNGNPYELFTSRMGSAETRSLGISDAKLLAVSASGELAFLRGSHPALRFSGPGTGTLARVSLAGGAPRDVLDRVAAADWIPGTDQLVVALTDGQVEFPMGTKFYKSATGGIRALRVAPDGARLALIVREPARAEVSVLVLDRSGRTIASSAWTDGGSLAWSPDGREVWFSATRQYVSPSLWAMSMAGETRVLVATDPEMHTIQDVFRDGRLLLASHMRRLGFCCLRQGESSPRELAWFDLTMAEALSADGNRFVFADRPAGPPGTAYLRKTDGGDAIRLATSRRKNELRISARASGRK
jgi:eukaryotic-like serine/threonine-protein kinase